MSQDRALKLPAVWNVPHARNPSFTGRERELAVLYAALTSGEAGRPVQAVRGLGGIGKTQLAVEYAYRHASRYDVVWWLRAEEPATLAADFADLAGALRMPGKTDSDQRLAIDAVKRWLASNTRWLLIFDSVREPPEVAPYLSPSGTGHVLITSRHASWRGVAAPLPLRELDRDEAMEFLFKRSGQDRDGDAAYELADALGDLPLALAQAGAYIEESGATFAGYLDLFRKRQRELLGRGAASGAAPTVATTWDIAFMEAQARSPAAAELLALCAFLAPDDVPRDALAAGADHLPPALAAAVRDALALDDAIAALRRYSLIESQEASLSTHRLVQAVVRERLPEPERRAWAERAVRLVLAAFPADVDEVSAWPVCARWLSHARAATTHAETLGAPSESTEMLLGRAAKYVRFRGAFADAKELFDRALMIAEAVHGPLHANVATILSGRGLVLKELRDLEGARSNEERALAIDEAVHGPMHPRVARDANALATVQRLLGDFVGARRNIERALAIDEATLGPDDPELTRRHNDLGVLLREMGDLRGAEGHLERALAIGEAVYGPEDPDVATFLSNLASVLQELAVRSFRDGDDEQARAHLVTAREHLERALVIGEASYGERHYAVAIRRNNLALLLKDMGYLTEAREHLERALAIMQEAFGPDHRRVIKTKNNLLAIVRQMQRGTPVR